MPISGAYIITSHYGQYAVEGLRNVKLDNKGIDIQGRPGAQARAIFNGKVAAVFKLNGLLQYPYPPWGIYFRLLQPLFRFGEAGRHSHHQAGHRAGILRRSRRWTHCTPLPVAPGKGETESRTLAEQINSFFPFPLAEHFVSVYRSFSVFLHLIFGFGGFGQNARPDGTAV